jgi:anaerobic magnesium-protoporphyrin IX monomethyl ester cyclase
MHILLINPSLKKIYGKIGALSQPSMGLAYLAAVMIKAGHEVTLADIDFEGLGRPELEKIIRAKKTAVAGITCTTSSFKYALETASMIKDIEPGIKVVMGGIHATIDPGATASEALVDYVVRGEGEETFRELADRIAAGREPSDVQGLTYRKNGSLVRNPDRPLIANLDSLPLPARELFPKGYYSYPDTMYYPVYAIHTSRGCYGRCTYCQSKNIYGLQVRFRSAAAVADEIETLIRDFKAKEIHVWDDNFAANKQRVFRIRDEIIRRRLKPHIAFSAGIRVETAMDDEVLMAMRQMGGYSIAFGVESGNQKILDSVEKGTTLEQARTAVRLAKKAGFEVWAFFMLGFPEDDKKTMMETIEFAKDLDPDVAKFHVLKPYPGSKIYEQMKEAGLIEDFNYENYGIHTFPVHHTRYVSAQTINSYQKLAYKSFYLRPGIFLKQLLRLKSRTRIVNNFKSMVGVLRLAGSGSENRGVNG